MASGSNVVVRAEAESTTHRVLNKQVIRLIELARDLEIEEGTLDLDEVIRFLKDEYKKVKAKPAVHVQSEELCKSNAASVDMCNTADTFVKKGSYRESLLWYTRSIALAKEGSEVLTQAYSKRADSLHRLRLYDECVDDMNRALAGKCTIAMRQKIQKRKYESFVDRKIPAKAKTQMKLQPVSGSLFKIIEVDSATATADAEETETQFQYMCQFDNAHIPNASSKIRLAYDEKKWGRYIEATENLKPGDFIASQRWFTHFLMEDLNYERCAHCLILCAALISCLTCSQMMYCSEKCRDLAYKSYHRMECAIMKLRFKRDDLNRTEFKMVRTLLIGTEQGTQLANLMRRMTVRDIMATDFPASETFVDDYTTALRLDKTYSHDKLRRLVPFAATMIETLEYVGFFDGDPSFRADPELQDTLTEAQIFAAFLLLNHSVGLLSYISKITTLGSGTDEETGKEIDDTIGSAWCTLYGVFNHSCDPNVIFFPRNRETIAVVSRPIKKGEELTTLYGPSFLNANVLPRNNELYTRYGFLCLCHVCINDWPTGNILAHTDLVFHDHIKQKRARLELKKLLVSLTADEKQFMSLPVSEVLRTVQKVLKWIFTNIRRPSFEHEHLQNVLFVLLSLRYGQFCENIPANDPLVYAHTILTQIANRVRIDLDTSEITYMTTSSITDTTVTATSGGRRRKNGPSPPSVIFYPE